MNYRFFVIDPEEYSEYPEIPELYSPNNEDPGFIMGAAGEEGRLMGLLIGTVSITDERVTNIAYAWCRRQTLSGDIFAEMLPVYMAELKKRKIRMILIRLVNINGNNLGMLNADVLEKLGYIKDDRHGTSGCYLISDFYDTLFMRTSVMKASQNENLLSFAYCSREECRKYLEKLGGKSDQTDILSVSQTPFSYFYMENNKPVGAMSIERYSQNSCIIDGAVIKESAGSERVFRSLLAGVLSGGLEGMGMQTRLYIRTDDSKYVRILEECLGERSYDAEISEYKYNL